MLRFVSWLGRAQSQVRRRPQAARRRLCLEALEERLVPSAAVLANYAVSNDWGSGLQAQITLTNNQATSVPNWNLSFDYTGNITSIWDAKIVSHVGTHYVIGGAAWSSTLGANASQAFGFVSTGPTGAPTGFALNGVPLDGSGNPVTLPTLSIGNASASLASGATGNATFTISLSAASTSSVSVNYATANGTALAGRDYQAVQGTLTFAPGQTQATVAVPVLGTTVGDTTFALNLSSPQGATLGTSAGSGTIHVAAPAPPPSSSGAVTFSVTTDWGSGFNGHITVKNTGATSASGWTLSFDSPMQISSIWNAVIVSHTNNHYVIKNADWNGTLAAGASTDFGFTASPGGSPASPTNFVLQLTTSTGGSGGSTGGTGGSTGSSTPLTAADDSVWTNPGLPADVNVVANDQGPAGATLTVASFTQAQHGTVTRNSNGTFRYTPAVGFTGSDVFTYTLNDGLGDTATGTVHVTVAPASTWPAQFYAPYVDMGLYPTYDLAQAASTQGVKFFTLAFVTADPTNQPAWGGFAAYDINGSTFDMQVRSQIAAVRSLGGDVMVSFGGASGIELAQAITNVSTLTSAYQKVVDAYNLTHLDFDIEGAALADHASIDRRSQAIAALQQQAAAAGKSLDVWFTLPVLPSGLTPDGIYLLQSAQRYGVNITGVNLMTMDYGDSAAPNPQGQMGTYAIDAAKSVFTQLQALYPAASSTTLWHMIGLTPMIGLNDVTTEVFDQQAAQQVLAFAEQMGLGRLSMWSLNRDQQNSAGKLTYVDLKSSSILQQPFEFSHIFEAI